MPTRKIQISIARKNLKWHKIEEFLRNGQGTLNITFVGMNKLKKTIKTLTSIIIFRYFLSHPK
jgi:hypothetical protein